MRSNSFGMLSSYWRAGLETRHLLHHVRVGFSTERLPYHPQLVPHHAEAEDVPAAIDSMPFAAGLFGTHVSSRPGVSWPLAHVLLSQSQPEVGNEWLAALVEQEFARWMSRCTNPYLWAWCSAGFAFFASALMSWTNLRIEVR